MRKSGLKNRFSKDELMTAWASVYTCLWCGKAHANCFHHIKSPGSQRFVRGRFNQSMMNACPINNFECHIGNGELHKPENEKMLAQKVLKILLKDGYELKKIDKQFVENYPELYKKT